MLQIIIKEVKDFLRDKTNLFFYLLFPVILVFLLGNLLSSMDKAEEMVGKINIQYIIQTENPVYIMSIDNFIREVGDGRNILFEETKDIETSRIMAGNNEIAAVVVFSGDPTGINIPMEINIYEGTNQIWNMTVNAIMNGFAQTCKAVYAIIEIAPESLANGVDVKGEYLKDKDLGVERSMLDYYAVTMLAMVSFMSIILGSFAFVGERQNKTINRLMIAPKNKAVLFLAKILGLLPQAMLQIIIIMVISVFVFNAHYTTSLLDNLYLFFFFLIVTVTLISIGALIGLFIKANPMAVTMPILWTMMFLSGTYSKEINIKGITDMMPIYQVQEAAFDLAIFGRYQRVNEIIIICIIIMVIMLSIGAFAFSRKEEER